MKRGVAAAVVLGMALLAPACSGQRETTPPATAQETTVPRPDLTGAEAAVVRAVEQDIAAIEREPESAAAWARLGARYRSGNWLTEAADCYAHAERLEPNEFLWPYRRGLALMFNDPVGAVESIGRALAIDPEYVPALVNQAQRLVRLGRTEEARTRFERALELDPRNAHALTGLGQLALAENEFESARGYLERARDIDPRLGPAHRALAQVYLELGDEAAATREAETAERLPYLAVMDDPRAVDAAAEPVGSVANVDVGKALLMNERPEEAVERLRTALEADPDSVSAHYSLALALIQLERHDEAAEHLEEVRRLRPDSPDYYNATAQMLAREGDFARAAELWAKSVELDPDDPEVHYAVGDALYRIGETGEAETHFRQSLELDPQDAVVNFTLGALLDQKQQYADAAVHLRRAAELAPDNADIRFYVGTFLARRGATAEAIPHLRAAARARPDDAGARINLGLSLSREGETISAADEFRNALRIDSGNARAHNGLANCLWESGQTATAIEHYREAARLAPAWTRPARRLAWIYATHPDARFRDAVEAVRFAEAVVRVDGRGDPTALDTLAAAYAESGRFEEAVEIAEEAADLASDTENTGLAQAIAGRVALYRSRRPYRDS